jgi:hypothetical protein
LKKKFLSGLKAIYCCGMRDTLQQQEVVSQSSPSRYFADVITTKTQAIAVVLSLAMVFFEVLPMSVSNTVSITTAAAGTRTGFNTKLLLLSSWSLPTQSSSVSTTKLLKSTDAAVKFNPIVTSYGVRYESDEHIITVVF